MLPLLLAAFAIGLLATWFASGAFRWQGNPIDFPHGRAVAVALGAGVQIVFLLITLLAVRDEPPGGGGFVTALAAWAAARAVTSSLVPLGGDEAYHWLWARHLDWCYYDHPGMVAWLARLAAPFGGQANALVRLSPLVLTSLLPVLAALLARLVLGDRVIARRVGLLTVLVPILAGGSLLMPMVAVTFFWLLSLVFLWQALVTDRAGYWLLLGLSFGAALNSNFTAVLLPMCLLAYLVVCPTDRGILRRRGVWLAAIVSVLCFMPAIAWNATHDWMTFGFNLIRRHREIGLHATSPLVYLLGLAGLLSPLLAVAIFAAVPGGIRRAGHERSRPTWFLLCFGLGPVLAFLATSLLLKPRPHYACTGFVPLLILFVAAGYAPKAAILASPTWLRRSSWLAGVCSMLTLAAASAPSLVSADQAAGLLRRVMKERVSKTVAQSYGWPALGRWLDARGLPFRADGRVVLITASYAQAVLIAQHARSVEAIYSCDEGRTPYGQQIALWWSLRELRAGCDAIIVYAGTVADGSVVPKDYGRFFDRAEVVDTTAPGLDPRLKYFTIVRGYGYKPDSGFPY